MQPQVSRLPELSTLNRFGTSPLKNIAAAFLSSCRRLSVADFSFQSTRNVLEFCFDDRSLLPACNGFLNMLFHKPFR